jgi:hypothetical protein
MAMELNEAERKKLVGAKDYSKGGDRKEPEAEDDDGQEAEMHAKKLIEAIHARDPKAVAMAHKGLSDCHAGMKDEEEEESAEA